MTGGWSGIRSGSYGSLDKELQISGNGVLPIQTTSRSKPPKMLKEKERLFHWICKFACRKKVGMLLLSIVSATVFVWVLYVGKGEDSQGGDRINIVLNNGSSFVNSLKVSPTNGEQNNSADIKTSIITRTFENLALPPPPPQYFIGYTLPPEHPCNNFALPPPPADKKRTGPRPCPVCYLHVDEAIASMPEAPSFSPVLKNLTYIYDEKLNRETEFGGSDFGGHPSLSQRRDSYDIRESMSVHCGFFKGIKPGHGTGFDMDDSDLLEMEQCRGVVVASAIFGAFDTIQQPRNISEYSKKNVCFFMFVDEETEAYLKNNSMLDSNKRVGLWRIVVVHNHPYTDGRRNGKIPKLLVHRIFPNSRYSLWIDGKLELLVDPFQVLERFLWRKNATFAISKHYKRFDVFIEAEANKAAAKYDNASIDFQIDFYKKEGLTPYSEAKLPITSDVPEGCVIIREHVPISNLAACLWFNEVDRFTSRDQISFSTVRDKIRAKINWTVYMFLDCERRNFVDQKYHRDVLERLRAPAILPPPLPPVLVNALPAKFSAETSPERVAPPPPPPPGRKLPRRARDRKSGSRRHRKMVAGAGDAVPN